jgi:4'-phosphopantetheinyl transferase
MTESADRPYRLTCWDWTPPGTASGGTMGRGSPAVDSSWGSPPHVPTLTTEDVHVWRLHSALSPRDILALRCLLSADELARTKRFRFPLDRQRFIAVRGALRQILARYLDMEAHQIRFHYGPQGKPSLSGQGEPGHSEQLQLHFSLSHAADLALVAVARGRRVGVDIESVSPDISGEVVARCFSGSERDQLHALPAHIRHVAFFNCWTRKEAYLKARGEGLSLPLDQFDVSLAPGVDVRLLRSAGDPEEASRWLLVELAPGPGLAAALAVEAVIEGDH